MPNATRRGSQNLRTPVDKTTPDRPPTDNSKHESLGDRASSKLTLDDELFDILYAFGWVRFCSHVSRQHFAFGFSLLS
ncbi:unnamed protein product [Heligmosomoides polygyrus]|uniref:Uncharacterized protein n=1 Tax=Heligmosomoides polygyrus TaxID=6339 RepID=A0A183FS50_HELPZ|nr:unnamed protein product [Heligmosomoides polygyrus]